MCNRSNPKLKEYLSVQGTVWRPSAVLILAVFLSTTAFIVSWGGTALADEVIDAETRTVNTSTSYTGNLYVGKDHTATLIVESGGTISGTGGGIEGNIGYNAGSNGTVTVTGAGSAWTTPPNHDLNVGAKGTGTLNILNGGAVNSRNGVVAYFPGSTGRATVAGEGSTWTNINQLIVGWNGRGEMTVSDGGRATANTYGFIGARDGGSGQVTVTGSGSTWDIGSQLVIGLNVSRGELLVENGGTVSNTSGRIGLSANSVGTVTVTGPGSTLTDNGPILRVGFDGTGTLTVANGGLVTVGTLTNGAYNGTLTIASNAGSTGTLNIGAAAGSGAAAAGTLKAASIAFGSGTGAIVFNHTSSGLLFDSAISGNGILRALAGTTILTGDNSLFTGNTVVNGGVLKVNGSLARSVMTVESGALLSGSGTVGSVTALAGSTVAPGNSPGTLTVNGNYTAQSGSTYNAEIVPGGSVSDLISVTGTAAVANGAILKVSRYGNGFFTPGTRYTVLTASGGLTGAYSLSNAALSNFYAATANYDANNAYLDVTQDRAFASAAATPNQFATAGGLQSLSLSNALRGAIGNLQSDGEARTAFDQLSGDIYPSIKSAIVEESRFIRSTAIDRIRSAFNAVGAQDAPSTTYGFAGLTFWANGYGAWSNTDSDDNASKFSHNTGGFLIGADAPVSESWRLGFLAGYGRSSYDADTNNASGFSDNYTLGAYGGSEIGAVGVRLGTAYTWSGVHTDRSVSFTGFSDRLSGQYDAGAFQAFGDVGYRLDAGETSLGRLSFEPFAALAYVNVHTNGFTEDGGLAALTTQSDDTNVTFSTAGLRGASDFTLGGVALTATGSLAWRHAYGDTTPMTTVSFSGSDRFGIEGVPIAKDMALIEAGLSTHLNSNVSFGISYTGQFAGDTRSQGIRGNLYVTF